MTPIEPITQQSLASKLGTELAIRNCAPVALYMLLKANGYLDSSVEPDKFCLELNSPQNHVTGDWSRPALSKELRHKYNAGIVSWQLNGQANIDLMKRSGYVESIKEIAFFTNHVWGHSIKSIVRSGYPLIVTMLPGFGTPENSNIHAVILVGWDGDKVTVVDPDARNQKTEFEASYVEKFISPNGAGTIVLPKP
jgi:hypothetical protein